VRTGLLLLWAVSFISDPPPPPSDRAMLQERSTRLPAGEPSKDWLFFGCRGRSTDFLYGAEFEALYDSRRLGRLEVAFSRDQANKVYVQHKIREAAPELAPVFLNPSTHFYLCGAAGQMPKDVEEALVEDVCVAAGGLTKEEAAAWMATMRKEKRWHVETWS
jgi:sulfite reductase (NADPH) flavoprotein alpha-component